MSIVDRILNGEFDDNDKKPKVAAEAVDPEEFEEDGEEEDEEEFEEEDEEEDEEVNTNKNSPEIEEEEDFYDPDVPSSEFMTDYAKENPGEIIEDISQESLRPIYVAGPKQSLTRDNKPMQDTPTPKVEKPKTAPKQSTTKKPTAKSSRKGPPYKLVAESGEVCRLYNEGVRAQIIAEKFNVSITCVIKCLSRNKVTIRPKGRRKQNTLNLTICDPAQLQPRTLPV